MHPHIRIGDAERDSAVERLRTHHAEGRLDLAEFDERMERALSARTKGDLQAIFRDLPDDRFGAASLARQEPANPYAHLQPTPEIRQVAVNQEEGNSQWGFHILIGAVMIFTIATGGRLLPLLIILGVYGAFRAKNRRNRQVERQQQAPQPKAISYQVGDMNSELRALIQANRKIEAIKRYREMTGAGLRDAKEAIEAMEREMKGNGF